MHGGLAGQRLKIWLGLGGVVLLSALVVGLGLRLVHAKGKHFKAAVPADDPNLPVDRGVRWSSFQRYSEPRLTVRDIEAGGDYQALTDSVSEFRPRPDVPVFELKLPVDWAANPFGDWNWLFQFHALRMTNAALTHFETTADPASFRESLAITLDWWHYHRSKAKTSLTVWESMTMGVRAAHLAYLVDQVLAGRAAVSPAEQEQLAEMVGEHVYRLSDAQALPNSNHALFQLRGLMLLCRVVGKEAGCKRSQRFLSRQLTRFLNQQFSPRGVHREHSPGYHLLAISTLEAFADPKGSGVYKEIADRLKLARSVWPWFVFPGGRVAALGDSEGQAQPVEPPANQKCAAGAEDCAEIGDFTSDGYAVVRSAWSQSKERAFMLIMTGSFNTRAHKHADDLSFELMDGGQMLFVDSGKYSYQPDPMRDYVISARAHNTIGLATRELSIGSSEHHATALEPPMGENGVYTLGGRIEYPDLFTQRRRLEYSPGHYVLIDDELSSAGSLTYESYLHLAQNLTPQRADDAWTVALPDGRHLRIESLTPHCESRVEKGVNQSKRIQGWITEHYGNMRESSALTFSCGEGPPKITLLASFDEASRSAALASLAKQAH